MLENLPPAALRRLRALKQLQVEHVKLQKQMQDEIDLLEQKYHQLHAPLYEKVWAWGLY